MRQMGFLGDLAPEELLKERFADDGARGSYEKADVWPDGKMPDVQTNQCVPYIEWHMPKELKTKAVRGKPPPEDVAAAAKDGCSGSFSLSPLLA